MRRFLRCGRARRRRTRQRRRPRWRRPSTTRLRARLRRAPPRCAPSRRPWPNRSCWWRGCRRACWRPPSGWLRSRTTQRVRFYLFFYLFFFSRVSSSLTRGLACVCARRPSVRSEVFHAAAEHKKSVASGKGELAALLKVYGFVEADLFGKPRAALSE